MIVTISGYAGAGKTTVGKLLAKKLDFSFYCLGEMRRKMAGDRGMTIEQFNKLGEKKFFTDKAVDEYQKKLGTKEDNFVMVSRLGFHFIPKSKKIFLKTTAEEAAKRVFRDKTRRHEKYADVKEARKKLQAREKSDIYRYKKYYQINPYDLRHYDFIVDTTRITPNQVVSKIIKFLHSETKP